MTSFYFATPYHSSLHCSSVLHSEQSFNQAATSVLFNRNLFPNSAKKFKISSRRRRFRADSVRSCVETEESRTQISPESYEVPSNGSTLSTSFLSYLCPLLKLFAVSKLYIIIIMNKQ